jgi:hypothetical protein
MGVLLFVLIPLLAVTIYAVVSWLRNRQPTSVESGIDAFRREMSALSPEAAPMHRRVDPRAGDPGSEPPRAEAPDHEAGPDPRTAPRRPSAGPPDRHGEQG